MEHRNHTNKERELLSRLGNCSKNMAQHHHLENLSEFVLHDVCSADLFNIKKAAYLVNNPDFTCLKGVAGYHHQESFPKGHGWEHQDEFTSHMKQSNFNQKVRSVLNSSITLDGGRLQQDAVHSLAEQFQINDPRFHIWSMKHDNQGLFIFEGTQEAYMAHDHLINFLYMLSFSSVF